MENVGKITNAIDKLAVYSEAAGNLAAGDPVGAAGPVVNDQLGNAAKLAGGWAGAKIGAAMGGFPGAMFGAVVGVILAQAGYDTWVKPQVDKQIDKASVAVQTDAAAKEHMSPQAYERWKQLMRAKGMAAPDTYEEWVKTQSDPKFGSKVVYTSVREGPLAPDAMEPRGSDLVTKTFTLPPEMQSSYGEAMQKVRTQAGDALAKGNLLPEDPVEQAILDSVRDRIAQLEREVAEEVYSEEAHERNRQRREELERLRQEEAQIEADRLRRQQEAAEAAAATQALGDALTGFGQAMSQQPTEPTTHQHPQQSGASPRRVQGTIPGHIHSDGTRD